MLPAFELMSPGCIEEACALKLETGGVFLAGGTDVFVSMHGGKLRPKALIDLSGIEALKGFDTACGLRFGALTPHRVFEQNELVRKRYTALYEGCSQVGSAQIRNRGTVGGNICNAVPSADSVGPLLVFGAQCVVAGLEEERAVPLADFFLGPKKTILQVGELLKGLAVPEPEKFSGSAYTKFTRRNAMDLALFGVACYLELNAAERIETVRIALTTAAPTPMRATDAENFLRGKPLGERELKKAGELAASQSKPRTSWRSSAEFRVALAKELTVRTVFAAAERAKEAAR